MKRVKQWGPACSWSSVDNTWHFLVRYTSYKGTSSLDKKPTVRTAGSCWVKWAAVKNAIQLAGGKVKESEKLRFRYHPHEHSMWMGMQSIALGLWLFCLWLYLWFLMYCRILFFNLLHSIQRFSVIKYFFLKGMFSKWKTLLLCSNK